MISGGLAKGFRGSPQRAEAFSSSAPHTRPLSKAIEGNRVGQTPRADLRAVPSQTQWHKKRAGRRGRPEKRKGRGPRRAVPTAREGAATPSNPVPLLRRFQRAFTARLATHSNVGSPSSRLRIPNSTRREPAPAVHVSLLLSGGTPVFRLTWGQRRQRGQGKTPG